MDQVRRCYLVQGVIWYISPLFHIRILSLALLILWYQILMLGENMDSGQLFLRFWCACSYPLQVEWQGGFKHQANIDWIIDKTYNWGMLLTAHALCLWQVSWSFHSQQCGLSSLLLTRWWVWGMKHSPYFGYTATAVSVRVLLFSHSLRFLPPVHRGTQAGRILSLAVAVYLAFQYFTRNRGLRRAFRPGSIVATLAMICITVVNVILLFWVAKSSPLVVGLTVEGKRRNYSRVQSIDICIFMYGMLCTVVVCSCSFIPDPLCWSSCLSLHQNFGINRSQQIVRARWRHADRDGALILDFLWSITISQASLMFSRQFLSTRGTIKLKGGTKKSRKKIFGIEEPLGIRMYSLFGIRFSPKPKFSKVSWFDQVYGKNI